MHVAATLRLAALLCLVSLFSLTARAEEHVFALVVSSNQGTSIAQAPLAYADDDGARYYKLFLAMAQSSEDTQLLTSFDAATRAVYPDLTGTARAATRANLVAAISTLAARVAAARAKGEATTFYFIFAGHGEVREGRGYLGLEDSAIDGTFLERELIDRIPADTKHIVLDSCDSFFVVNPRKPGGRRWATPADMTFGFSARHPEVGVFLSTNSEEEVFEWSRLEAGVFSHEVRSGLRGGADVNRDGRISYGELAGFVTRANEGIARESLRPHLFFRGPGGARDATLFRIDVLRGGRLALGPEQTRAWVIDATGERVFDLHKEAGALTMVLPEQTADLSLFAQDSAASAAPRAFRLRVEGRAAQAEEVPVELASRGHRIYGELFSQPYGPRAFAAFARAQKDKAPEVFGLSQSDTARASYYVGAIARASRQSRLARASVLLALAAPTFLAAGLERNSPKFRRSLFGSELGVGVLLTAASLYSFLVRTPSEKAFRSLREQLARGPKHGREAFVQAESELGTWARRLRLMRGMSVALPIGLAGAAYTAMFAGWLRHENVSLDSHSGRVVLPALAAGMAIGIIAAVWTAIIPSTEERLIQLYRKDPTFSMQLSANVSHRGGSVGVRSIF